MREISKQDVLERLKIENPWWQTGGIAPEVRKVRPRAYLKLFLRLLEKRDPHRATILMGPRRVGKTWMIYHAIAQFIQQKKSPSTLCYINLQNPLYNGLSLEQLLKYASEASGISLQDQLLVCFDEIQYLREWEIHLKSLVDTYRNIKFVGSGSAAAALRLKSTESGAGRFTDFLLPPLTFYEYLELQDLSEIVQIKESAIRTFSCTDIEELNVRFVHYLNYGGYPEVVFSQEIQADPERYIRGDIIDKVLMKDLPGLYGIQDVQELNSLFQRLTYNTGGEVSLEDLSQKSGVSKNTIKRYIEYLESAFLIKIIHRVDRTAKRFVRATRFKVYLTNPSLYCALFAPVTSDSITIGNLVETAVFAQWFHSVTAQLHYARWKGGEVDIVRLDKEFNPNWAVEVKWSDEYIASPHKLAGLIDFSKDHPDCAFLVTTRSQEGVKRIDKLTIEFKPASLYCYMLGYNIIESRGRHELAKRQ